MARGVAEGSFSLILFLDQGKIVCGVQIEFCEDIVASLSCCSAAGTKGSR